RREVKALRDVVVERLRHEILDRREQLLRIGDRILRLPAVIEKRRFVDVAVRRDALPERAVEQLAMMQRRRIDGRLEMRDRVVSGGPLTDGLQGIHEQSPRERKRSLGADLNRRRADAGRSPDTT